jgi:hypothetical protein
MCDSTPHETYYHIYKIYYVRDSTLININIKTALAIYIYLGPACACQIRANSVCGYFLCGDHRREITTAQENHNDCGKSKHEF